MAYQNFSDLIKSLHTTTTGGNIVDSGDDNYIEITTQRQFIPSANFDGIIAYEGDVNSQIITFKNIKTYDTHILSNCNNHEIRWKNLSSGAEGVSTLNQGGATKSTEEYFYMTWEVPPELCTQAGTVEISICHYDTDENKNVTYSWNTSRYTGLSIGKSMDSVGFSFPAKDEILVINSETRSIVAPLNYNNIICNYGDSGVASVYFLIDRYIGKKTKKIDLLSTETNTKKIITIYAKNAKGEIRECKITELKLYSSEITSKNEGLIFFEWTPPDEITCDNPTWIGKFQIYLNIEIKEGQTKKYSWNTNTYDNLEIGKLSFISSDNDDEPDIYISTLNYFIDKRLEEKQVDDVLEYASINDFPEIGASGILYISQNDGATYRWGKRVDGRDGYIDVGLSSTKTNELIKNFLISNEFVIDANYEENTTQ